MGGRNDHLGNLASKKRQETDLVILNHGQVRRTPQDLAPSPNFKTTPTGVGTDTDHEGYHEREHGFESSFNIVFALNLSCSRSSRWFYKEPQVTQVIRSNRLRWLNHIWRSPENNQTRDYTFKNPMGSRTLVRDPIGGRDPIEEDHQQGGYR
ncbi:hypothetical protein TNCV_1568311 [Trichonephila clavipes]|nr:hypothetical protein TNCV_1568311 [Trichonephila clavipes]